MAEYHDIKATRMDFKMVSENEIFLSYKDVRTSMKYK